MCTPQGACGGGIAISYSGSRHLEGAVDATPTDVVDTSRTVSVRYVTRAPGSAPGRADRFP